MSNYPEHMEKASEQFKDLLDSELINNIPKSTLISMTLQASGGFLNMMSIGEACLKNYGLKSGIGFSSFSNTVVGKIFELDLEERDINQFRSLFREMFLFQINSTLALENAFKNPESLGIQILIPSFYLDEKNMINLNSEVLKFGEVKLLSSIKGSISSRILKCNLWNSNLEFERSIQSKDIPETSLADLTYFHNLRPSINLKPNFSEFFEPNSYH